MLRTKIQNDSKDQLGKCQKSLKEIHYLPSTKSGDLKIQKDRLTDELMKTVTNLQKSVKSCMEKEKV